MQANTGEPDIESQPNRASNLQEYVEGSSELNPKMYNEGNAGEDYLDLLKRACHREIIYEAKSSDFGPALKVNLAALQRMVLCAIQKQLLDNASAMTVGHDIIALDEVRLNRIKILIVEYGRDACVFGRTVRTVIKGASDQLRQCETGTMLQRPVETY